VNKNGQLGAYNFQSISTVGEKAVWPRANVIAQSSPLGGKKARKMRGKAEKKLKPTIT